MRMLWAVLVVGIAASVGVAQDKPKDAKPDGKAKGQLPTYWKQLGLSDEQVQKVYKIQAKYNDDIDKLEAQIKDMKEKMAKERSAVLTAEQKKRLEDIIKEKVGGDKKDK
jgi:Spy/CpxP family protein refolding chaperone